MFTREIFESTSNGEMTKTSEPSLSNRWTGSIADQYKSKEKGFDDLDVI
jgi:hypothetical protein